MQAVKENLILYRNILINLYKQNGFNRQEAIVKADLWLSNLPSAPAIYKLDEIISWYRDICKRSTLTTKRIPLNKLQGWRVDKKTGNILHEKGSFFSIIGLDIKGSNREISKWQQPIINQPEIGILGFIVKKINNIYHFLIQAKEEPGNIKKVQLSPTIMATRSNFSQAHGGKKPAYIDYFLNKKKTKVLIRKLQSEEGARFYKKSNLNMIVEVKKNQLTKVPDNFIWVTLYQLKELLKRPNTVNASARSVISCLP